jgi:hypothetical protein
MTFTVSVIYVTVLENKWKASVEMGKSGKRLTIVCENGELSCRGSTDIRHEPVSYDTILEQVEEMIEGVEIPEIETGKYGEVKE